MRTMISKWGNSLALRLPRHVAEQVRLAEGTSVRVEVDDGSLRVTPTRKKLELAELLKDEKPHRRANREIDWGKSEGDEIW